MNCLVNTQPVNARLLITWDSAFYAIIENKCQDETLHIRSMNLNLCIFGMLRDTFLLGMAHIGSLKHSHFGNKSSDIYFFSKSMIHIT